jgi:hypothetical protein
MTAWLLAVVLWFIGLAGVGELPAPGKCATVVGPLLNGEHREMCIDEFGTMRERGTAP